MFEIDMVVVGVCVFGGSVQPAVQTESGWLMNPPVSY